MLDSPGRRPYPLGGLFGLIVGLVLVAAPLSGAAFENPCDSAATEADPLSRALIAGAIGLERLAALRESQADAMERVATALVDAARADRLVYLFGTGHSHMLAEEEDI